ncbi:hypothetical protein ACFLU6_05495 [Acidobacteriota bacterium]
MTRKTPIRDSKAQRVIREAEMERRIAMLETENRVLAETLTGLMVQIIEYQVFEQQAMAGIKKILGKRP